MPPLPEAVAMAITHLSHSFDTVSAATTVSRPSAIQALASRQQSGNYFALPLSYAGLNSGPSAGTVVGITLGSVIGFLLILWLIQSLFQGSGMRQQYIEGDQSSIVVRRDRRRPRRTRPPRSEVSEVSRSTRPPPARRSEPSRSPRRERTERVVVDETRVRTESRARGGEGRVENDDIVEVVEEESVGSAPRPPRRSRRESGGAYRQERVYESRRERERYR